MRDYNDNHPLDLSYLTEMVGHNAEFLVEVFDTFLEQTPIYLAELDEALLIQNWGNVAKCAHRIKPTFSYFGRTDIRDFVQTIEDNAKKEISIERIPKDIEQLKGFVEHIYMQIEDAKKQLLSS